MAKYFGIAVKTGKMGSSVFSVRNGVTIERQYQPIVNNPQTEAQVKARAKLKLISQLSEIMAPVIAIPRMGLASSRNLFVRRNYPILGYSGSTATIPLESVQLTDSVLSLPGIVATPSGGGGGTIAVRMASVVSEEIDRVVYIYLLRQANGGVRLHNTIVVSSAGESGNFSGTIPSGVLAEGGVVLAYGIVTKTETARVKFENLRVPTAAQIAQLVANRVLTEKDIDTTETVGTIVTAGA